MSKKINEEIQDENVEEMGVEATESQDLAVVQKKGVKIGPKMKKGLKIAGVAGLGILSFILGAKWGSRSNNDSEDMDDVEYEVIDSDKE